MDNKYQRNQEIKIKDHKGRLYNPIKKEKRENIVQYSFP